LQKNAGDLTNFASGADEKMNRNDKAKANKSSEYQKRSRRNVRETVVNIVTYIDNLKIYIKVGEIENRSIVIWN